MNDSYGDILNPEGEQEAAGRAPAAARDRGGGRPAIGLLNNSKPNVAEFLAAVEIRLRAEDPRCEIVKVVKPRSAGPCPDIARVADRCDYVINAVAD